jgi:hypothetical protein
MKSKLIFAQFFGALTIIAAACGGKVVVDAPGDGGAGGTGQGGSGLSSSNGSTSGGPTSTSSSSSGQPSPCDLQNDCAACVNCAVDLVCPDDWAKCQAQPSCANLVICLPSCAADQACITKCLTAFPDGIDLYNQTALCVMCQGCFNDCNGLAKGCF